MRLTVLYFSGTGNTEYVARYLSSGLSRARVKADVHSIEQQAPGEVDNFDLLVVGFPVYVLDSPGFVQEYLSRLPQGEARGAFVFCTKGFTAGNAVNWNLRRLAGLGYTPLGGASVSMPGTDGLAFLPKRSHAVRALQRKDYGTLPAADRLVERIARTVSESRHVVVSAARRGRVGPLVLGPPLSRVTAWVYHLACATGTRLLHADGRCTSCGLCAQACPTGNITLVDGHPQFGSACALCMRCLHTCPAEAIQIGRGTVGKFRWHGPMGDFDPLRMRRSQC